MDQFDRDGRRFLAALFDADVAAIYVERSDTEHQYQLASDERCSPRVLAFLAVHGDLDSIDLLEALASNERTPPEALETVAFAAIALGQAPERLGTGLLGRSDLPSEMRRLLEEAIRAY